MEADDANNESLHSRMSPSSLKFSQNVSATFSQKGKLYQLLAANNIAKYTRVIFWLFKT